MSFAEYYEELGHLRAQIEHKNAQIRQLQADKDLLDQANQAMHDQASRDKNALRKADAERTRLINEITRLNKEKDQQQAAMQQLQEQVAKQQKTIKVQSDQIANPKTTNKLCVTTPQHLGPHGGAFNQIYSQPPPTYGTPQSGPPSAFPPSTPAYPPPMSRDPSSASSAFGTPLSRQPSSSAYQATIHPGNVAENMRITDGPAYNSFGGNNQLAMVKGTEPMSVHLLPEYAPFFSMVEKWARNYCNVPDKVKDQALPSALVQYFRQHTNVSILPKLMCSGSTRYFAVAKVMNQTLVGFAFRPVMVKGFTLFYDKKIADLRAQLQEVAIPLHVRRACLVASAQTIMEMTKAQSFKPFLDGVISHQVHEMWAFMEPLFAPGIARNEAWEDLEHIWREAARIGMLMMSKASTFTFDFPPVGSNSHFNPSNMVSKDVNFKQDPQSLGHMAVTIRLSITPIVTETDFMGNGGVVPRTLYYSNVLLEF